MGGPQVDVLNRLEAERRPHIEFIDELEHVLRVGEHARLATEEYQRRLRAEVAQLEAGSLTARIGKLATVKTAGAEARESLLAFVRKVGIGDESMVRIFQSTEVDAELEAQNCARNLKDLAAMMATYEADLDAARRELRPIEMAYRNFLATTTGSSPPRVNMPRKTPTGL